MKIVIVGGVAGGASAATRARRMNEHAEIIMFEKDEHVSFANCGLPYYIGEEIKDRGELLVATPEFLRKRFRLDVRTREEVIAIDRQRKVVRVKSASPESTSSEYEQPYDKLILCTGATPLVPPLPGVTARNVHTLRNLADTDRIKALVDSRPKGKAVVVGAGFIGLEMVEQLVHRGWHVTLVERSPQVLPLLDREMVVPLQQSLKANGVELCLSGSMSEIELDDDQLATAVCLADGTRLPADLVILGIGVRPNITLAQQAELKLGCDGGIAVNGQLQTSDPDIYAAGDTVEYVYGPTETTRRIALAGPANRAGRLAGEHAASGRSAAMAPVMGTSVVRVFDVTAAMTGLTVTTATRMKVPYATATVQAKHHAGYFPGAEMMTLKIIFDPESGRVLGAQGVGGEGVDKRIDVIATAMYFKATVYDLAGLDLAYAPPYGSAKDPVHQVAFVACNQLDGIETFVDPHTDLEGYQVVDVRTVAEVAKAPLASAPHAINIPVDELRQSLDQLDLKKPTVVCCGVGVRGHIAARILKQAGFDVYNLSGGATLRNQVFDHYPLYDGLPVRR